jgi:hypothetical protein
MGMTAVEVGRTRLSHQPCQFIDYRLVRCPLRVRCAVDDFVVFHTADCKLVRSTLASRRATPT